MIFAGSVVVPTRWAAGWLRLVLMLGARRGRYRDGHGVANAAVEYSFLLSGCLDPDQLALVWFQP